MKEAGVKRFLEAAAEVSESLKSYLSEDLQVRLASHTDPDGISSGSILARCLYSYDVKFHIDFSMPLRAQEVAELSEQDYDLFIFLDQGTGQISSIQKYLLNAGREVMILDHHPGSLPEMAGLTGLNPHFHGLSGSKDASASVVAYSIVRGTGKGFEPLSVLSLIGALGDRQEAPSGFSGVNRRILEGAMEEGIVSAKEGLKLVGRDLPIVECLGSSIKPYLLGLTGNERACQKVVEDLGIGPDTSIAELELGDEKKLRDEIVERVQISPTDDFRWALWGTVYTSELDLIAGPRNLHEYVAMLDACDELGRPEVGFGAMLGDEESKDEAMDIFGRNQEKMIESLGWLASKKDEFKTTSNMRHIYVGDRVESKMIGETISIAIESGLLPTDRPIFGLADSERGELKVSARAKPEHVKGGGLGEILGRVSEEIGGSGGGHDVAAGARIPRERVDEFIAKVDRALSG